MNYDIWLSPPFLNGQEQEYVRDALQSNWVAPYGPHLDLFEQEIAHYCGSEHCIALQSGTAAIHLALKVLEIGPGDEVVVPSLTFAASVFPITYLGAKPVLFDVEPNYLTLNISLLADWLYKRAQINRLPKAILAVHLYGNTVSMKDLLTVAGDYGIYVIEDAAESLGSVYKGKQTGSIGVMGVFSFNGNKIITTSGGGALVTNRSDLAEKCRYLANQAKDPAPWYQHTEIGYNYRMSNVLAAIGRAQLTGIQEKIHRKRAIFDCYKSALGNTHGIEFIEEPMQSTSNKWLTVMTLNLSDRNITPDYIREKLTSNGIESRPVWKPMHQQPVFSGTEIIGGQVSEYAFEHGLCLPSGSGLIIDEQMRVINTIKQAVS